MVFKERTDGTNLLQARVISMAFHDMDVFPSKSQVHEMLSCASECSNHSLPNHITFGEFCVFSTELQAEYRKGSPRPMPLSKLQKNNMKCRSERDLPKPSMKCEVFLGGSCNPTTWRQDLAIPVLKKFGITYYNPQVPHWVPELIELENQAKESAETLFFVIDNQTRSVASIIEAAYIAGSYCQKKLVLVILPFQETGQLICGEAISKQEYIDLTRGHAILQDLVERQGIPVFDDISIAINCVIKIVQKKIGVQDLGLDDLTHPVKMAHVQLGDKLIKLREVFDSYDTSNCGEIGLPDVCLAFRTLTNQDLTIKDLQAIIACHKGVPCDDIVEITVDNIKINFDQFCCIYAEFKNKRSESNKLVDTFLSLTSSVLQILITPLAKFAEWLMVGRSVRSIQKPLASMNCSSLNTCVVRDVYLGGGCSLTNWQEDIAIPLLKKHGLTYYNPQLNRWGERYIPIQANTVENSRLLLFVISKESRSLACMAVAAHYIGLGCSVVLCIQYLQDGCVLKDEVLSEQAIKDYNRGRMYLSDLANHHGVPVFEDIEEGVECTIKRCKSRI